MTPLTTITIEKADNGYIVFENLHFQQGRDFAPSESGRKVFETTRTLNKYIEDNFILESHD